MKDKLIALWRRVFPKQDEGWVKEFYKETIITLNGNIISLQGRVSKAERDLQTVKVSSEYISEKLFEAQEALKKVEGIRERLEQSEQALIASHLIGGKNQFTEEVLKLLRESIDLLPKKM